MAGSHIISSRIKNITTAEIGILPDVFPNERAAQGVFFLPAALDMFVHDVIHGPALLPFHPKAFDGVTAMVFESKFHSVTKRLIFELPVLAQCFFVSGQALKALVPGTSDLNSNHAVVPPLIL
jgi:hypothetical protein